MKNIHIIPTDKPSRLAILGMSNTLQLFDKPITFKTFGRSPQNIYITSDEEIKDGDYYLYLKDNSVQQFIKKHHTKLLALGIQKKIILTDNKDLIADGVQAITDEFLEWFLKNPSCDEVEVLRCPIEGLYTIIPKQELPQFGTKEFYTFFSDLCDKNLGGKPKQETMSEAIKQVITDKLKQETLEEVAEKYHLKNQHPQNQYPKKAFIEGAKWQQEEDNKKTKILEIILDDNYDLNVQFHKIKRECIYSFATAIYDEKLTFEDWEKKHYGNYVEQPKWQMERSYSEEEVIHLLDALWDRLDLWYNDDTDKEFGLTKWFNECELKKK